jgi:Lon protease-like protein
VLLVNISIGVDICNPDIVRTGPMVPPMIELPMFPLEDPVVPHTAVPLHIFEDRYRRMLGDIQNGDGRFGIVMIERGSEIGGADVRAEIGTLARIADADRLEDGRWIVVAVGIDRIRILEWLPDDPYPRASVESFPALSKMAGPAERDGIETAVRRVAALFTELGESGPPTTVELADDPVAAAYQAIVASPIGPHDSQRIMEIPDGDAMIEAVRSALAETEELIRMRLASG